MLNLKHCDSRPMVPTPGKKPSSAFGSSECLSQELRFCLSLLNRQSGVRKYFSWAENPHKILRAYGSEIFRDS